MKIKRTSPVTKISRELDLDITDEEMSSHNEIKSLEISFPRLTSEEREYFRTGIWGEDEWETLYSQMS